MRHSNLSEAQLRELAGALAATAQRGCRVSLMGDLGAGKTSFVKGFAQGLGLDPTQVTSPTFNLILEHPCAHGTMYHIDLYRLEKPQELDALGLVEICHSDDDLVLCEWADRFEVMPEESLRVAIRIADDASRRDVELTAPGEVANWLQRAGL